MHFHDHCLESVSMPVLVRAVICYLYCNLQNLIAMAFLQGSLDALLTPDEEMVHNLYPPSVAGSISEIQIFWIPVM